LNAYNLRDEAPVFHWHRKTRPAHLLNAQLRKVIKTRGHVPTDDAAMKLIWLGLRNITAKWTRTGHGWKGAMNQFAVLYGDRFMRPNY
jgi:putative transposase